MIEKIKDFYYSLEEKYYEILDKINEIIPIYGIVDAIDSVMPSFLLFLIILFLVILFVGIFFVAPIIFPEKMEIIISVLDKSGNFVEGAKVKFIENEKEIDEIITDDQGIASLKNIDKGKKIKIVVEKQGYISEEREFEVTNIKQYETITLTPLSEGFIIKTIRLLDSSGMTPQGYFTLNFYCPDNPYATPPATVRLTPADLGKTTVKVPKNCGRLVVSVKDEAYYQEIISKEVITDDFVINLSSVAQSKGIIKVYITSESEEALNGIKVSIHKFEDSTVIGPIDYAYTSNGYASFEQPIGEYLVKAYDPQGVYQQKEYSDEYGNKKIVLEKGTTKNIRMKLEKAQLTGKIKVKVLDKQTKQIINRAKVRLEDKEGAHIETLTINLNDNNGVVIFNVNTNEEYVLFISADGYISKRIYGVKNNEAVNEVNLEKCTPYTCGTLKVKVIDRDNIPVEGATVFLFDLAGSIAYEGSRLTDINGIAKFNNVKDGSYIAYAYKGNYSNKSICNEAKECAFVSTIHKEEPDITLVLNIPNGTLRFYVRDEDGNPVPYAQIFIYDYRTNEEVIKNITDANGTISIDTKADKKIYAKIIAEDKAIYTTTVKAIEPSTVTEFNVVLYPKLINKNLEIVSLGMTKDSKKVLTLAAGERYTAKFLLKVPEGKSYNLAGVHIRVGDEIILEKDKLYIESINIPNAKIIKATYFDEKSNLREKDYKITEGHAKWFNATFEKPVIPGVYEIEFDIFVKENASIGDQIKVNYRAFAKKERGEYERYPTDVEVVNELYANTKTDIYEIGALMICDEEFCFAASIEDTKQKLLEYVKDQPYAAKTFNEYLLKFTLLNNSDKVHNQANLRIKNEDKTLLIKSYKIGVAEGKEFANDILNGYELPWIDVGDFRKNDSVVAHEIIITPQKQGDATITLSLVSDKKIVWSKNIGFSVMGLKDLEMLVNPQILNIGIENDINVLVFDKETRLEVEGAKVKLLDKHDYVIQTETTRKDGYVFLTIPASSPSTKYKLIAEKENYNSAEAIVEVTGEIIKPNPTNIAINLNAKTKQESEEILNVANIANFDVKIEDVVLTGNFKGYIDLAKTNNALYSPYANYILKKGEILEMHVRTFLSEAGKLVNEPTNLEGKLKITVGNFGKNWTYEIPVKITIGIGGEADNPNCLTVTRKDWVGVTEGQPVVIEFEIQNNCTIKGKPIELKTLEARVDWKSNELGKYTIKIGDNEVEIRGGYYKTLFQRIPADSRYVATLKFTPYGGIVGNAEADILIRAHNPLEEKDQALESKISTKIGIENMLSCISFDKEYIVINLNETQDNNTPKTDKIATSSFNIKVEKHCNLPYEIELESKLKLTPKDKFNINPGASKTVEIFGGDKYPGQYPIYVKARMQGEASFRHIETIKVVIIKPNSCIQLNKFEFDIYDNPKDPFDGYDTAILSNLCPNKYVNITVDMKDWKKAIKDGASVGLLVLTFSLLSKAFSGKNKDVKIAQDSVTDCYAKNGYICDASPETGSAICVSKIIKRYSDGTVCCSEPCKMVSQYGNVMYMPIQNNTSSNTTSDTNKSTQGEKQQEKDKNKTTPPTGQIIFGGEGSIFGLFSQTIDSILGESPISKTLNAFIIGTAASYFTQEKEISFKVKQKDLEINTKDIKLLIGEGQKEQIEKDIQLAFENVKREALVTDKQQEIDNILIKFINKNKITTTELNPKYDLLKVTAIRHKYVDKKYKKDDFEIEKSGGILGFWTEETIKTKDIKLEEENPEKVEEKFSLEFNSIPPEVPRVEEKTMLNCQSGTKQGITGTAAFKGDNAPLRIKLKWDWGSIADNECDEDNENYIYCDGVQFSIAVLKKIRNITEFLRKNKNSLKCPTEGEQYYNTQIINNYDLGIEKITREFAPKGVKIIATLKNKNPLQIKAKVNMYVVEENTEEKIECKSLPEEVKFTTEEDIACEFELKEGEYYAYAEITPKELCNQCQDDERNNKIGIRFSVGSKGAEECEPYSTERLPDFIAASGLKNTDKILKSINFKAYLIKDRFTSDLQKDFDTYYRNYAFMDTPTYYYQEDGLGEYFKNFELFRFVPMYEEENPEGYALPSPGLYDVTINIEFKDNSWELFKDGKPNAKIRVKLDKLKGPIITSPFYYMPFDGPVGIDDGRIGYGVNFEGDVININEGKNILRTVPLSGTTSIEDGLIKVDKIRNFKRINVDDKGVVLKVERGPKSQIVYSPSHATPIIMEITNQQGDAYAYYSIEVDGAAQNVGYNMTEWYGVGINCKSFNDKYVYDEFWSKPDTHALPAENRKCSLIDPNKAATAYGFEFCNPSKFGKLYLQTIIYTPYKSNSIIKKEVASDDLSFISSTGSGSALVLSGSKDIQPTMESVEGILNLVKEGYLCVSSNDVRAEFFWNPKAIYETKSFYSKQDIAVNNCIKEN